MWGGRNRATGLWFIQFVLILRYILISFRFIVVIKFFFQSTFFEKKKNIYLKRKVRVFFLIPLINNLYLNLILIEGINIDLTFFFSFLKRYYKLNLTPEIVRTFDGFPSSHFTFSLVVCHPSFYIYIHIYWKVRQTYFATDTK